MALLQAGVNIAVIAAGKRRGTFALDPAEDAGKLDVQRRVFDF